MEAETKVVTFCVFAVATLLSVVVGTLLCFVLAHGIVWLIDRRRK